jgi:lysophospholipase L1-like esterase
VEGEMENTAVIPVSKLEEDCYDWWERHDAVLAAKERIDPEIVMIGDSITHFWGGEPDSVKYGGESWGETFGDTPVLNLGFGWDRTQNVLWRLENGEFEGLHPRAVVLNIGTNNMTGSDNARANTPEEICEGVETICRKLHSLSPETRIVVMGIFPRGEFPTDPLRAIAAEVNALLPGALSVLPYVTHLQIGEEFLEADGTISPEIMFDFCHLTPAGYAIWAKALIGTGVIGK